MTIGSSADSVVEDPSLQDAGAEPVARRIGPTGLADLAPDGLEALMEAGAFRIVSVECEVVGEPADRGMATWTVTVKLTDVDRLRRLASQAHPDEAALIADSLAVAWQRAVTRSRRSAPSPGSLGGRCRSASSTCPPELLPGSADPSAASDQGRTPAKWLPDQTRWLSATLPSRRGNVSRRGG